MNVLGSTKKILGAALVVALPLSFTTTMTGCLTNDKPADTTKVVSADTLTTKQADLGAQANSTLGSFLDLDDFSVMKQTDAEAYPANVDLIFAYSGTANAAAAYSPDTAQGGIGGNAGLDIAQGLTTVNHIILKTIDAAKYDAAKTQADLQAAYDAGVASANGRLLLSNDFAFAAKSHTGKLVAIKVSNLAASTTGSVTFTGRAKF